MLATSSLKDLSGKRFLVTGSNGFIANNLVNKLKNMGGEVINLNRQIDLENNTYSSKDYMSGELSFTELGRIDCIFHLAAVYKHDNSRESFREMQQSNLLFTNQLIFDATFKQIPLIISGSYTQNLNAQPNAGMTPYASLKNASEIVAKHFSENNLLKCGVTRIYESYGDFDSRPRILNRIIDAALTEDEVILPKLNIELNLLHVDDLTEALIHIYEEIDNSNGFHVFKIAPVRKTDLSELIEAVEKIVGSKLLIKRVTGSRSHIDVTRIWDIGRLPSSWIPRRDVFEDLEELIKNRKIMKSTHTVIEKGDQCLNF